MKNTGMLDLKSKMEQAKKDMGTESAPTPAPTPQAQKKTTPPVVEVTPSEPTNATTPEIEPKLFVNGRLDRKNYTYLPRSLHILEGLLDEIHTYCKGNEVAIYQFLIHEGLKSVKTHGTSVYVDIKDMELSFAPADKS